MSGLNPNIALAVRPGDPIGAIGRGLQLGQQIRNAPLQRQLLEQQAQSQAIQQQAQQQQLQQQQAQFQQQRGQVMNRLANKLRSLPESERAAALTDPEGAQIFQSFAIDPRSISLTNEGLDSLVNQTEIFTQQAQAGPAKLQFGRGETVQLPSGENARIDFARNPQTGQVEQIITPFEGEIVSSIGETPAQRKERELATAEARGEVGAGIKIGLQKELSKIKRENKRQQDIDARQTARLETSITNGLASVQSLADVNRGLELIEQVGTGGITAKSKAITDFFGTTSGDVGELNNLLAQNILTGLQNFKGAISDGERAFIQQMETNLGQGTEFNKRQMKRMQGILQRQVKLARDAAEFLGMEFELNQLNTPFAKDVIKGGTGEQKRTIKDLDVRDFGQASDEDLLNILGVQ